MPSFILAMFPSRVVITLSPVCGQHCYFLGIKLFFNEMCRIDCRHTFSRHFTSLISEAVLIGCTGIATPLLPEYA
jgi:hypothetical protein